MTEHVVLITGATGGVGRGIALACGTAGWTVWIASRRAAEGERVAAEVTARGGDGHFVSCEVQDPTSVAKAVATAVDGSGRLDGAVHNATSSLSPVPSPLSSLSMGDLHDHVAVSLRGSYLVASASAPHLRTTRGALVLLTSEAGFEGKQRLPAYAAVKAAQRGLARSLAREWGPDGVRVNCIAPLASTPAMEAALAHDPTMNARVMGRNPLGRLGDAEQDIGPVVEFLLGSASRYLTGNTLMADGGSCPIS